MLRHDRMPKEYRLVAAETNYLFTSDRMRYMRPGQILAAWNEQVRKSSNLVK